MAEIKEILTKTITTVVGTLLNIYTYFETEVSDFLQFFIRDQSSFVDGVSFSEGDLGYTKSSMNNFSGSLNDSGELVVVDSEVDDYFVDEVGELISGDILSVPALVSSTPISTSSFAIVWESVSGASGYYLDVAYDVQFNTYVEGYQNLDVNDVTEYIVEGVESDITYYWRVRAYSEEQVSESSDYLIGESLAPLEDYDGNIYNVVRIGNQLWTVENWKCTHYNDGEPIPNITLSTDSYSDWFLPSKDELNAMYVNLYLEGVGEFSDDVNGYWSSSEHSEAGAWYQRFSDGLQSPPTKTGTPRRIRVCRVFTDVAASYSLRDPGPTGGLIFYIDGTTCYEAAPLDLSSTYDWSSTISTVGTTLTAIGEGQNNTNEIVAMGYEASAAKLADDYEVDLGWRGLTSGAYCWYSNDIGYKDTHGALYNWYVVDSGHDIEPSGGWRIPSVTDFSTLTTYLGGTTVAGGKLKEMGLDHWDSPNTGATNEVGFTGLGSGYRGATGLFIQMGQYFFSLTTNESGSTCSLFTLVYNSDHGNSTSGLSKKVGCAIRLVKDVS